MLSQIIILLLEVSCVSLQNLGLKQEALNEYESLYLRTDRIDVLYTITSLQFELGNLTESLTNLEILLNNSQTEEMVARVSKGQNDTQDVPYRAQLNYLKGLVYIERDEKELAKKAFNLALTLSPDFQNASDKLGSLLVFFIKSTSFTYIYIFFILFHQIIIMRSHDYACSSIINIH